MIWWGQAPYSRCFGLSFHSPPLSSPPLWLPAMTTPLYHDHWAINTTETCLSPLYSHPHVPVFFLVFIAKWPKVTLGFGSLEGSFSCLTVGVEEDEWGAADEGDDTGTCGGGLVFASLSGLFCRLSPPCKTKGESPVGVWPDLDFPRSDRSRGPSYASLSPSPETLSALNGGISFFSLGLVWLPAFSDILLNLNTTVGSLAWGWELLCLCQWDPNTCLRGLEWLACWLVGIMLGKRDRFGLGEGCTARPVAAAAIDTQSEDSDKGQGRVIELLLIGWGRQGTGAWSKCLLGFTSSLAEEEEFLMRRAWGGMEDRRSSPSTLWALSYETQKTDRWRNVKMCTFICIKPFSRKTQISQHKTDTYK